MKIILLVVSLLATVAMSTTSERTSKVATIASDFSLEAEDFAALIADERSYNRSLIPAQRLAEVAEKFHRDLLELSSEEVAIDGELCQRLRASINRLAHRYRLVKNAFASDQKLWRKERLAWANESLALSYRRLATIAGDFVNDGCR